MEYKLEPIGNSLYIKGRIGWKGLKKSEYLENGEYRIINGKSLTSNGIDWNECGFISKERYEESPEIMLETNDIVITKDGTIGKVDIVKSLDKPTTVASGLFVLRNSNPEEFNTMFIYYFLKSPMFKHFIDVRKEGSVIPHLYQKDFVELEIPKFHINKQKLIARILGAIDNKIGNNKQIIANLEELSQTLFKRWFVDFEFPDENGNPYKSSGGDMVESELGVIPKDWSIQTLNDISESYNTKRKPLSKLEREKVASIYPYYGATKIIDYVDDYLFDGKFILVGEDGTVQTEEGHPFVQYVWGQFWVSNHAHILKGKNLSDEVLMLILNNIDIQPYITGAVQPKISKKNLNSIKIVVGSKLIYGKFDQYINTYYKKIREVHDENKYLTQLRDTLLPKLMSGEIKIPDDIEVNEDELSI
ncbi:restriction endonuclease subunit S [Mammaliicoccus sciuri]|uniref:restriction endonuclease subunit S n=1 Tax=Mammaliicoccus sciuri TaxID=1296 RepID=UPI002DB574BC|nr:restriction endonuclease subunit S [Mammaliicoccus sciuri]MEB7966158.1 restriction endonuclease subunit S [Mammaliicoccus sciuri]